MTRGEVRGRRPVVVGLSVLVVIAAAVAWLVFYSSLLGVQQIQIRGAQTLSDAAVGDVLAIPHGTPLARVDTEAAEAALEGIPQVESATVSRGWPDTLVVRVVERSAVAAVDVGGSTWLVDRFGVLFAQVSALPEGIVVLQVDRPGPDDRATAAALEVIAALDPGIRAVLVRVSAPSPNEIELELAGGRTVIWGSADGSARKSQILAGLLAGGVVGSVYDVSSPTSVVLR